MNTSDGTLPATNIGIDSHPPTSRRVGLKEYPHMRIWIWIWI